MDQIIFEAMKAAAQRLYDELAATNVEMTGCGVGLGDGDAFAIRIYLMHKKDAKAVPSTFEGFPVKAVVTGAISAL